MRSRAKGVRAAVIAALVILFSLPLVFLVMGSLRQPGLAPPDGFELIPPVATISNYGLVDGLIPLWTQMRNSIVVVAVAVPLTVLVASWAGFAVARASPRTRRWLIVASLVALMVPVTALWVPRFVMYRWTGLLDTLVPLIAPALMATTPFYVLLFAFAYSRIPTSLFEAAELDGASAFGVWRRIAWPLSRGTAFAVAVLAFVWHWANLIDPLLYVSSADLFTLPLGLSALRSLEPANHSILLAGAVIVTLPAILAFLIAQRSLFERTLDA